MGLQPRRPPNRYNFPPETRPETNPLKTEANAKKLAALLKRLKPKDAPPQRDPVEQLVVSFLNWETTRRNAEQAFEKLMSRMVDINELRVTFEPEIVEIIGGDYPMAAQRVMRMREALNEVYLREHDIHMNTIANKGKKDQRHYLDSLPATPQYVAAQVALLSFGAAAIPVDNKLVALLAREEVIDPATRPEQVESFILKNIKADDALDTHLRLAAMADDSKLTPVDTAHMPARPESLPGVGDDKDGSAPRTGKKKKLTKKTTKKR